MTPQERIAKAIYESRNGHGCSLDFWPPVSAASKADAEAVLGVMQPQMSG